MVRILRLVRLIRILKVFSQLFLLVSGLTNAMRTLFWVAVMLFICLYTCAIFLTLTVGHDDNTYNPYFKEHGWDHEEYFGDIWSSMFSLFQITTLDHWAEDIARHVMQRQPAMVWFFLGFVLFSSYGLLSLVIGVIVESTLAMAKLNNQQNHAKRQADRKRALDHIKTAFEQMDEDGSGTLSMLELKRSIEDPEIATRLKMIEFPIDEPEKIFVLMDVENRGELDIEQFIRGCMRLGGQAQSKDILEVLITVGLLGKHLTTLEEKILMVQTKTMALDVKTETMVNQAHTMFANARQYNKKLDLD
jgi:voltage-gated sodium channel